MTLAIRYALYLGGFAIVGFNLAMYYHARALTHAYKAWRWLIIGQTGVVVFLIVSMKVAINENKALTWQLPILAVSMIVKIVSMYYLIRTRNRSHSQHVL